MEKKEGGVRRKEEEKEVRKEREGMEREREKKNTRNSHKCSEGARDCSNRKQLGKWPHLQLEWEEKAGLLFVFLKLVASWLYGKEKAMLKVRDKHLRQK
jgi:hypothetical protein